MTERALATIREITNISPIDGADRIELIQVGGWNVVSQKGQGHEVGGNVVYFEIDSFLPATDDRYEFLLSRSTRTDQTGSKGHVLKTIRLKGQYSQGLILPLSKFPEITEPTPGTDVTKILGITKWDPPLPAELAGQVLGFFPSFMPKTDSERVQNLECIFPLEGEWEAHEKVDGTSATFAVDVDGVFWVCSRNMALKENESNTYWKIAREHQIEELLRVEQPEGKSIVIQGEIYGEGIQSNPLGVKGQHLAVFNFMMGHHGNWVARRDYGDLPAAPQYDLDVPQSVEEAVAQAEGLKSLISPERQAEGIVWNRVGKPLSNPTDGKTHWKAINNKFLIKNDR